MKSNVNAVIYYLQQVITHYSPWATRGPHAPPPQLDFFGMLLCI